MHFSRFLTVFIFITWSGQYLQGQNYSSTSYRDISRITLSSSPGKKIAVAFMNRNDALPDKYNTLAFSDTIPKGFIPNNLVTKKAVIRFGVSNRSDTIMSVWFFPGFYCWNVQLFNIANGRLAPISSIAPPTRDSLSFRKITVGPHDSMVVIAELTFAKTYLNAIRPRLIHPDYLSSFVNDLQVTKRQTNLITYLFCGLLIMMILYSLANFVQGANKEFLYYSLYALFLGTMLFLKTLLGYHARRFSFFQEEYLDFILQDTGYLFYMIFMQKYLATKAQHPFLHRLFNGGIILLIISTLSYTYSHYFTNNFNVENGIENLTKVLLLSITLVFIIYSFRNWNNKFLRYLFWGNLCLFICSLFSQLAIMADNIARQLPGIFQSSLFYYEAGLFLELVFFLMALNFKNRRQLIIQVRETERLKAENQVKEYEKELAVFKAQQQERERISADMHDELGSGMTAIRLMSEIARNKMKNEIPAEIEKISQSADEVLNKMNAIIWSMDSGNDTLDSLVSYIRSYALEYFESTPVHCTVNTPGSIPPKELTGDKRRNIFLCIKETLNNTLKHSKAREVKIDFTIDNDLVIKIADDGVGIDMQNIRQFGNGLKNIARRMESIGGTYKIKNETGTLTVLSLPLN